MCFVTLATASPVAQILSPYGYGSPLVHAGPVVAHAPYSPYVAHAPVIAKHIVHEPVDPNPHYR